jgi:hypothetical protein
MKTLVKSALVAVMTLMVTHIFAQEWTKEQLEVWQVAEKTWTYWKTGDVEGANAVLHEKYQGWSNKEPLPMSKEGANQWFQLMKDIQKIDMYTLNPARITVSGDAAVVDYYFYYMATYISGDQKIKMEGNGKNVEFYVKAGGKWLLLGDMTVFAEDGEDE